jgi:hypothetical protein
MRKLWKEAPRMDGQRQRRARAWVKALLGFYIHATVYGAVNVGLLLLNLLTSPGYLWFLWPLVGWGIGLAAHGLAVFGARLAWTWEERRVRALLARDEGQTRDQPSSGTWPNLTS